MNNNYLIAGAIQVLANRFQIKSVTALSNDRFQKSDYEIVIFSGSFPDTVRVTIVFNYHAEVKKLSISQLPGTLCSEIKVTEPLTRTLSYIEHTFKREAKQS